MYFCSPMNYKIKSPDDFTEKESLNSKVLNFINFHIDGQTIGRLFFANNKTNLNDYVNFIEKP